jgi:hypothetical protein
MTAEEPLGKLILSVGALLPWIASLLISGDNTQATLEWAKDNQWQAHTATILELAAVPLLLAGVLVYWRSTRTESSNLALLAAVGLTIGYVGLTADYGSQGLAFSLADDDGVDLAGLANTIDANTASLVAAKVLAFGGWLLGVLAALAAVRSPAPAPPSRIAALAGLALLTVPFATVVPALDPEVSSTLFWAGALFAWGGLALAPFRQSRNS